jgi:hypothetical protein
MPVLAFFAVVGSVLIALLFVADATLEENASPVIVTSQRTGLPTPRYHNTNATKTFTTPPAPEPDMKSQAVLAAQPESGPGALPKIESEARAARAEARPNKRQVEVSAKNARAEAPSPNQRLTQVTDNQQKIESEASEPLAEAPPQQYRQNQFDRFSIKGY